MNMEIKRVRRSARPRRKQQVRKNSTQKEGGTG
jgi:hypothetical protein